MVASQNDSNFAGWLALVGVALLYLVVYRGIRYPFMTVAALLVGTAWALGWTTLTVGHLNILSSAFAVMLIGMGDYGVLWVTRFGEERRAGADLAEAMRKTAMQRRPQHSDRGPGDGAGLLCRHARRSQGRRRTGLDRRQRRAPVCLLLLHRRAAAAGASGQALPRPRRGRCTGHPVPRGTPGRPSALAARLSRRPRLGHRRQSGGDAWFWPISRCHIRYDHNLLKLQAQDLRLGASGSKR